MNFQVTVVPFLAGSKYFSVLRNIEVISGFHSVFCSVGKGDCFGRAKEPECWANCSSQCSTEA